MKQERYLDKFNIFKQFKDRLWSQSICCCVLIRLVIITTLYHESANTCQSCSGDDVKIVKMLSDGAVRSGDCL